MIESGLLLAGIETEAASGDSFEVLAPATELPMGRVARGGEADIQQAVAAAREGFLEWSARSPGRREEILLLTAEIMAAEGERRFLDLLIDESGSTINKARCEISDTLDLLRTAAGEARRLFADTSPNDNPRRLSMVVRESLGVVAVVSPGNAPLALLCKMVAFPLAAGNAVVITPSEETPLIALAFGKLLVEAGLPAAALSVIPGLGAECGQALVQHPAIDAIALSGSTAAGVAIGASGIQRSLPMQLELCGKSTLLVLRDYDPEQAAVIAVEGMFNHTGQVCMANSRVVVEAPVFNEFCAALKVCCEALHLGDLRDPQSAYGALVNRRALEKVQSHQQQALLAGAHLLTGGQTHSGLVYEPTVLLGTPPDCAAWREETPGPLMNLVAVSSLDEGIAVANDIADGLSAGVLTHSIPHGLRVARELNCGTIHIGMHPCQVNTLAPAGGVGYSGVGGRCGSEQFTRLKRISFEVDA